MALLVSIGQLVDSARGSADPHPAESAGSFEACPLTVLAADGTKNTQPGQAAYDIGHVVLELQKQPIRHDFALRNVSNTTVAIDRIEPQCPCTSAFVQAPMPHGVCTVLPGEQVKITVAIDPRDLAPAPLDKSVVVFLAGQQRPVLTLHITGMVGAAATYSPSNASFDQVPLGTGRSVSFIQELDPKVYRHDAPDPVCSDSGFEVSRVHYLDLATEPGKIIRKYTVKISPRGHRLGYRRARIAMPDKNGGLEQTVFEVDAVVVGDITSDQTDLSFGLVKLNGRVTLNVMLTSTKAGALAGLKIACASKQLKAEALPSTTHLKHLTQNGNVRTTTLRVTFIPSKIGTFQGKIEITTRSRQVLELPVSAYVRTHVPVTTTFRKPTPSALKDKSSY